MVSWDNVKETGKLIGGGILVLCLGYAGGYGLGHYNKNLELENLASAQSVEAATTMAETELERLASYLDPVDLGKHAACQQFIEEHGN